MPTVTRDDGAEIWWEATGPEGAPAVVLVMGLGYPAAMWWRQVPALADRCRVIVLDNRGAGRTGDVVGAPYSVPMMAADVLAVLDAAGERRAHVVGISMGGMIAQEVALAHPERVASVVLLATHPGAAHATFRPEATALLSSRASWTPQEAAEASIPFNYAATTPREAMEDDWAVRLPLATTPAGYLAQLAGTTPWTSLDRLSGLQPPALVVHGADDALIPVENGRLVARSIPGSELVVLADANHVLTTDQTAAVNALILDWVARHSA
ncbi:alpha/beta fold hydrolase [Nocardioides marmoribigeumensis]|uniref:Pimeloyl-ACP methyl ester carboxylesterase n=1 Tax=Nocardioides marmoribigeumensis TaxID=433649 RepID=A0ABU2BXX9_9ACTN|nr:alpha/beta hydrolase [Nocardioides marmoribigeumensis]MDR7363258.1 pimeloyl-ACP methyl ester carboxylesterase [Nocardioides marmoribigeumensis]